MTTWTALLAVARKDYSGLLFAGGEPGIDVTFSDPPVDAFTVSYWVRRHHPAPVGRVIAGLDRELVEQAPDGDRQTLDDAAAVWSIEHRAGGIVVSIGAEQASVDLPGADGRDRQRVVVTWASSSGEVQVMLDGERHEAGPIAGGSSLAAQAVVGRVGGGAASGFVGHAEQVAIAAKAIAVAATISHIPTGRIDDGAWTLAEPSIASLDGTPWRRADRGGAVVDVDNPSREHITDRSARANCRLARASRYVEHR